MQQICSPPGWQPIETAFKDRLVIVYIPPGEGLGPLVSLCKWHPDAGFCTDEYREPTHWMPFVEPGDRPAEG